MIIKQPKNVFNGSLNLVWDKSFGANQSEKMHKAQMFIDSESIRLMKPYTPFLNGVLEKSATLGTKIGSGEIHQNTPYARFQYYAMLMVSSITGSAYASKGEAKVLTDIPLNYNTFRHPMAGKLWFERMKADHKEHIKKGAARIAGGIPE